MTAETNLPNSRNNTPARNGDDNTVPHASTPDLDPLHASIPDEALADFALIREEERRHGRRAQDTASIEHPAPQPPEPWRGGFLTGAKGGIRANLSNVMLVLENAPEWLLTVQRNAFSGQIFLQRPIPSHTEPPPNNFRPRPLTDADVSEAKRWFELDDFPTIASETVREASTLYAWKHEFHPVRDYLTGLKWDGNSRIYHWLLDYCGASADGDRTLQGFISEAGAKWLISAVARIFEPGCQVDHILILEGPQGIGKTQALRVLASPEWFSDSLPHDLHGKDAKDHLCGKWIIELSELAQMKKAEVETIKSFISRREERYRRAYGRLEETIPRQCIFAGTTNKSEFLRDETGNRRFWPVRCSAFLLEALKDDRDQLWAEAVHRYRDGESWHLTDRDVVRVAQREQQKRFAEDTWSEVISEYLLAQDQVTVGEIMRKALRIETPSQHRADQNRVIAILESLDWKHGGRNKHGRLWVKG